MYFFNPPPVSKSLANVVHPGGFAPGVRSALSGGLVPAPVAILGIVVCRGHSWFLLHSKSYCTPGGWERLRLRKTALSLRPSTRWQLCFQGFDLSQSPDVPLLIRELGAEKGFYQFFGQLYADYS